MTKETLFSNWDFMRFLRLGLGIYIAIQAIETQSILSGIFSGFFIFQAVTNTGCCGSNNCAVPIKKNNSDKMEEVEYEEVK
ncbi:MAG TPA: hypothetical protein VN182_02205 [Flavobacterium sp.]|jgi:hypothetical protein|nr:hypothetical protein [Flavobacterium sp.]